MSLFVQSKHDFPIYIFKSLSDDTRAWLSSFAQNLMQRLSHVAADADSDDPIRVREVFHVPHKRCTPPSLLSHEVVGLACSAADHRILGRFVSPACAHSLQAITSSLVVCVTYI